MLIFLLIVGGLAVLFTRLPTSFLPEADQGSVFVQVQLPVNASAERTRAVLDEVSEHRLQEEGDIVGTVMTIGGFTLDRKTVVSGKSVSVRLDLGGRRIIKNKKQNNDST